MTPRTFDYVIQLQNLIKHQNQVKQIHGYLITTGHLLHNSDNTSSKWKTTLLFTNLIRSHLNFGQYNKTLHLFTLMLAHQSPPNSHTFPPLIKAATFTVPHVGNSLHAQLIKRGVLYDPFILTSLVNMYGKFRNLPNARNVFDEIPQPDCVENNAMLDAYARNRDLGSTVSLFNCMRKRDIYSWTTVISGFMRNGCFVEAIGLFREMILGGEVKPNEATYVCVLSSCANLDKGGALLLGKQVHCYIIKKERFLTALMGTALIDCYGKLGCLGNALTIFNRMVLKSVCTWNALISSLANNGREKQSLEMFELMKTNGFCPNEVTFVAILTACARAKLVEFGLELFQSMVNKFGIKPVMEHYGCIVDLLGRAGLLREARAVIKNMPFKPDSSVLGAFVGACRIHGEFEMASIVLGKKVVAEVEAQRRSGLYVGLSSICFGAESWSLAADMRQKIVDSGIRKAPAFSLIDSPLNIVSEEIV